MNSAFRITDSTDWIGTSLPVFEALEASLRCQVCKEFYDTPTITACSHTFCSLCIRKSISNDGKCPTCRSSQQADKLRVNWVVGDVVEKFKDARPMALEMARKDKEIKEQGMRSSSKRKIEDTDLESEGSQRETRARRTRNRNQTTTSSQNDVIEVPDSEEEGDEELEPLPDGMARCPICDEAMKEAAVFSHLDRCPGEQKSVSGRSTRSRTNNAFSSTPRQPAKQDSPAPTRISQLNYSLMKDQQLRKRISEAGIPSWGPRQLVIQRHTEWVNLVNANCDAKHPKSKQELLKELNVWERSQGGRARAQDDKIMRKDFDHRSYAQNNKQQFDDLIANARSRVRKAALNSDAQKDEAVPNNQKSSTSDGVPNEPNANLSPEQQSPSEKEVPRPYENNQEALSTIREKVKEVNRAGDTMQSLRQDVSSIARSGSVNGELIDASRTAEDTSPGMFNPFSSPDRKMPMFKVPEEPVVDVEQAATVP